MAIQKIHAWSKDFADCQNDTIAKLYSDQNLGPTGLHDIYAFAKVQIGIPNPEARTSKTLKDAKVEPPVNPSLPVQFTAIKAFANVNRFVSVAGVDPRLSLTHGVKAKVDVSLKRAAKLRQSVPGADFSLSNI